MATLDVGAALALLDDVAVLVVALLIGAIVFFLRWEETADRSAYAVGTLCAVAAPAYVVVAGALAWTAAPDRLGLPAAGTSLVEELLNWLFWVAGWALLAGFLFFALRPLWLTGLFLRASQGAVRRRFKQVETAWQFAVVAVVSAKLAVLAAALLERFL